MKEDIDMQTLNAVEAISAQRSFMSFVRSERPAYDWKWYHETIARRLQDVYSGKIKRLMLFVPPQHGKSEIASRLFPAWCLGKNPDLKIIGSSYSSDLAQSFSRDIQRVIDDDTYHFIFPDTYLSSSNVRTDSHGAFLRNVDKFETVNHGGFYKAVGVCGSLTGTPADIAVIDDPVKDAIEAYSSTYRERVWDWYMNVLMTRMHNDSKIILIMTRWHMDDLAGRLLEDMKHGGEKWEVIQFPAIKEGFIEGDPRAEGEALWPERHDEKKLLQTKRMSVRVFNSLYQQHPVADEGNIFKRQWFGRIELPALMKMAEDQLQMLTWHFRIDTAYTDKTANDPTGLLCYTHWQNNYYIRDFQGVRLEMPALIEYVKTFTQRNGYTIESTIKVEPKASGLSLIQMLKANTGLNVSATKPPVTDKVARANIIIPMFESGRVFLCNGGWNEEFIYDVCAFPVAKHDEAVDCLYMMLQADARSTEGFIGLRSIG